MTSEIAFYQNKNRSLTAGGHDGQALLDILRRKTAGGGNGGMAAHVTAALLKQAHEMIMRAEDTIVRQDQRIAVLEDIMTVDEVTGLQNRRGFCAAFTRELARCERGLSTGGLLAFIEIDNLRVINETHSAMAANACLRLVARALEAEIRAMDTAARVSADEFVLLLPHTAKKEAAGRIQDLGWRLNNLSLAWYGDVIPVRAGLGLRAYGKGDRTEEIFGAAVSPRPQESGRQKDQQGKGHAQHP